MAKCSWIVFNELQLISHTFGWDLAYLDLWRFINFPLLIRSKFDFSSMRLEAHRRVGETDG